MRFLDLVTTRRVKRPQFSYNLVSSQEPQVSILITDTLLRLVKLKVTLTSSTCVNYSWQVELYIILQHLYLIQITINHHHGVRHTVPVLHQARCLFGRRVMIHRETQWWQQLFIKDLLTTDHHIHLDSTWECFGENDRLILTKKFIWDLNNSMVSTDSRIKAQRETIPLTQICEYLQTQRRSCYQSCLPLVDCI